jgi:hypothetical protein
MPFLSGVKVQRAAVLFSTDSREKEPRRPPFCLPGGLTPAGPAGKTRLCAPTPCCAPSLRPRSGIPSTQKSPRARVAAIRGAAVGETSGSLGLNTHVLRCGPQNEWGALFVL